MVWFGVFLPWRRNLFAATYTLSVFGCGMTQKARIVATDDSVFRGFPPEFRLTF
jgi:hypothetical protein